VTIEERLGDKRFRHNSYLL